MSEWWTYRLSNFLLFSPRTYYRLFELYNLAVWPAQLAAALLGLAILYLLLHPDRRRVRLAAALLAVAWLWVAVAFFFKRYATINWAAVYFGWAFVAQAALLAWSSLVRDRIGLEPGALPWRRAGFWIFLFALLIEPLTGPSLGRAWQGIEVFGMAPDPTAVGTLGVLLLAAGRGARHTIAIPAIWCAITGATLMAMDARDAWVAPVAAVLSVVLALRSRRRS